MIPFTQYLRPDGRRILVEVERPAEIEAKAQRIIEAGYRFECEHLGTILPLPNVSLTISNDDDDVAIEICRNGPEILTALDRMITNFEATM